jgi:hypothetical protein
MHPLPTLLRNPELSRALFFKGLREWGENDESVEKLLVSLS